VKTGQAVKIFAMGNHRERERDRDRDTDRQTDVNPTKHLKKLPFDRLIDNWDRSI
jgi:hypothetical protein